MNNTKVYFLNEEKKISWYFADIITVKNRQYGFTTHESGKFTAYDVLSGERIGIFEHLIDFMDRINEPKFEEIFESDKYKKTCAELKQALFYFKE